jgi:SAM-dependent methyltransferase
MHVVSERTRLARWLGGSGLELGPGHIAFECPADVVVTYVDRWPPADLRKLFPELGDDAQFTEIDVFADFDRDGLRAFGSRSQDFVICSHVLEHLADPLGLLAEIYRVLRRDGIALVLLPDRRRTFDRDRPSTSLEHLVAEHAAGVKVVDDQHLFEFITLAEPAEAFTDRPLGCDRDTFYAWHRERSIHVHCWTEDEFDDVLDHARVVMRQRWTVVDRLPLQDDGFEFGFALRKAGGRPWPAATRREPLPIEADQWAG